MQEVVQAVEHDAGPHAHRAPLQIQVGDLAVVAGEVNDQAVANGPADQAGAGPARDDRDGRLDGGVNQEAGLLCVGGESDGLRRDLVNRRVGRIELARQIIEGDFAVRTSERYLLLG